MGRSFDAAPTPLLANDPRTSYPWLVSEALPQSPPVAPRMPTSIHLVRALLGLAGFGASIFAILIIPALALHFIFSLYSILTGHPAEPATVTATGDPLHLAIAVLSWISFRGMCKGRREKSTHRLAAICLAYWTLTAATSNALTILGPPLSPEHARALGQGVALLVMGTLFVRFTFGRASRIYFRVINP
jgi:hypothetical protein